MVEDDAPPAKCPACGASGKVFGERKEVFSFLDMPVKNYMRRVVYSVDASRSVLDAAQSMKINKVGSVIVTRDGSPVGIVTERDLLYKIVAEDLKPSQINITKVMSSPVVTIGSQSTAREALQIMAKRNFRRILVVEDGRPVGLVAEKFIVGDAIVEAAPTSRLD